MLSNTTTGLPASKGVQGGYWPYSHIAGNNLGGCHDAGGGPDCDDCIGRQPGVA
jgi:hypothetical protein